MLNSTLATAQCAMCQQVVTSNLSDGRGSVIGRGINIGILTLLIMPYLTVGLVIFFWFRTAKKELAKKIALQERMREIFS